MVPIADIVRGERKSRRRKEEDEVPSLLCFTITKVRILTQTRLPDYRAMPRGKGQEVFIGGVSKVEDAPLPDSITPLV